MTRTAVFSIPMRLPFRGITVREGMLIRGDAGWGEFSPFLEYEDAVAAPRVHALASRRVWIEAPCSSAT